MLTAFPDLLADRMRELGFDIATFADEAGVSDTAVSNWLHGKYAPASTKIRSLARVLQVDEVDLRRSIIAARAAAATPCPADTSAPEVRS